MALFDWFFGRKKPATPQEQLDRLLRSGAVRKVHLYPPVWGGQDIPQNTTWLPPGAIGEKEAFEATVATHVESGKSVDYSCELKYEGDSRIPSKVLLAATGPGVELRHVIDVSRYKTW
jgi:hypothetical protein